MPPPLSLVPGVLGVGVEARIMFNSYHPYSQGRNRFPQAHGHSSQTKVGYLLKLQVHLDGVLREGQALRSYGLKFQNRIQKGVGGPTSSRVLYPSQPDNKSQDSSLLGRQGGSELPVG